MKKEIVLASALLIGGGGIVEAQEAPVVDTTKFLGAVRENIDYSSNPKFFKQMERRAKKGSGEYFKTEELAGGGTLTLYYPDGPVPRVGYRESVTNIMVDDAGLTPEPTGMLNAFAINEAVILDIEQDGSLGYEVTPDLLNWNQIQRGIDKYFLEPTATQSLDWQYVDASGAGYASLYKLNDSDPQDITYIGGNQAGFLTLERQSIEIPMVGTDISVK